MERKKAPTGFRKPVGEMRHAQARPHPVRMRRSFIANPSRNCSNLTVATREHIALRRGPSVGNQ